MNNLFFPNNHFVYVNLCYLKFHGQQTLNEIICKGFNSVPTERFLYGKFTLCVDPELFIEMINLSGGLVSQNVPILRALVVYAAI